MPPHGTDDLSPANRLLIGTITAICSGGAALGYAANRDPLVLLEVPLGAVLMGAAVGIGAGLALGLADGISNSIRRGLNRTGNEQQDARQPTQRPRLDSNQRPSA
jgi:hypothetical protein